MKNTINILLCLILIIGCKSKEEAITPQATTNPSFEYYLDGEKKGATDITAIVTNNTFILTTTDNINIDESTNIGIYIYSMEGVSEYGVYTMYDYANNDFSTQNSISINIGQGNGNPSKNYYTYNLWNRSNKESLIEITSISFDDSRVSGEFYGILYGSDTLDYHIITNGMFKDVKLLH